MTNRTAAAFTAFLACLLGGCSSMRAIDTAAADFSRLADSASKLADKSAETIDEVKQISAEVTKVIPTVAEDTRALVQTFEESTREMGAATKVTLEQTAATMKAITPELTATLETISSTTTKHGTAIENISAELGRTTKLLGGLIANLKANNEQSREWIQATQKQLNASMLAAERTLDQTAESLVNMETGLVEALGTSNKTLSGINRILRLEAEDDDEAAAIRGFGRRLDQLVTTFLWVFLGGGVLLIVISTLFVHDKLTRKGRLRRQLAALGLALEK